MEEEEKDRLKSKPFRWITLEFLLYYCIIVAGHYVILYVAAGFSEKYNNPWPTLSGIKPGWIFGRQQDLKDHQYRSFREQLSLLLTLMAAHCILKRLILFGIGSSLQVGAVLLRARISHIFHVVIGIGFITLAFGLQSLYLWLLLVISFGISRLPLRSSIVLLATWTLGLVILLQQHDKDPLGLLSWLQTISYTHGMPYLATNGLLHPMTWNVAIHFLVLRMISFASDSLWCNIRDKNGDKHSSTDGFPKHALVCAICREEGEVGACLPWREKQPVSTQYHSFWWYLAYCLYVPLYFAGPILSFNAFVSQVLNPQRTYPAWKVLLYACRCGVLFLLLELYLHYIYVYAVSENGVWTSFSPLEVACLAWATLEVLWLKFSFIWKLFRCWALIDGVETEENMTRCVDNLCSIVEFWRAWHRSFNRWLVRYLYVPLGGFRSAESQFLLLPVLRRICNIFLVFTFVAIWHDVDSKLLAWAWLIALFFIPEVVLSQLSILPSFRYILVTSPWARHLQALGGVCNIWMSAIGNLVGYNVGLEGTKGFLSKLFTSDGWPTVIGATVVFFARCQVMLELRRWDASSRFRSSKTVLLDRVITRS